ncbi:hypothetical protein [Kocuria palustris]|uniref:hypothetical protein n=1 Tax=Kocuria palustris TaxID=71999 RepID=UPI002043FA34|nr:hypothetical protein [Kocuria palustris]MCM3332529.1 hypothetical protein [Kocuria palustris]
MSAHSTPVQPSAWTAEHDENGHQTHAMGPSIWEAGIDIYTASDPHRGPQAYDVDGNVIPTGDLLKYAVRLLQIHDVLLRAQRQHDLANRQAAQK